MLAGSERASDACGHGRVAAAGPARAKPARSSWYDRAIVIDALGGVGDPYGARGQ